MINKNIKRISDASGFTNLKLTYPIIKKMIFLVEIKKFVKKTDLVLSNKT